MRRVFRLAKLGGNERKDRGRETHVLAEVLG